MEERTLERTPAAGRRGLDGVAGGGCGRGGAVGNRQGRAGAGGRRRGPCRERLAARAYLYALFQHLFAEEPNESFVQAVDAELAREAFVLMGGTACDAEAFGKALAGLEDVPARRIGLRPPVRRTGRASRATLGVGLEVQGRLAVHPHHAGGCAPPYRAQGFIPERYPQVSDDHLALELDFLARLAQGMQKAWEEGDSDALERARQTSASFLEEHLGAWIGPFSADLANASSDSHAADLANACQGPYATAARLLERLVRLDAAFLDALPSTLKGGNEHERMGDNGLTSAETRNRGRRRAKRSTPAESPKRPAGGFPAKRVSPSVSSPSWSWAAGAGLWVWARTAELLQRRLPQPYGLLCGGLLRGGHTHVRTGTSKPALDAWSCHEPRIDQQISEGLKWVAGDFEDSLGPSNLANTEGFCLRSGCHTQGAWHDRHDSMPLENVEGCASCHVMHLNHAAWPEA